MIRSDGTFLRDYIYVKDVVRAYMVLAEQIDAAAGDAFNFSPEHALSVLELVDLLRDVTGCQAIEPDVQNTAQGEIHSQYLDASKAGRILGWEPQYSLQEGLTETTAWYRQYLME
jgi:CDP-glucose 4,6-dehydratase